MNSETDTEVNCDEKIIEEQQLTLDNVKLHKEILPEDKLIVDDESLPEEKLKLEQIKIDQIKQERLKQRLKEEQLKLDEEKKERLILSVDSLKEIAKAMNAETIVRISNKNAVTTEEWVELDLDVLKELNSVSENTFEIKIYSGDSCVEKEFTKKSIYNNDSIISDITSNLIIDKFLKENDRVLFVVDQNVSRKYEFSIFVMEITRKSYKIGACNLSENMASESILESILEIAQEIVEEGREGKKIGTLFVVGDEKILKDYTRQLIMNPFKGYEKEFFDIGNVHLRDTIKNFAQLDGAFIINNEGRILSAGTYIDVDTSNIKPYAGWGTKHLAAVAITKETESISILVSESGGRIKVFKKGKLMLRI